jgi:hypothetical protein
LNQIFFQRIEVEVDGLVRAELAPPFAELASEGLTDRLKAGLAAIRQALKSPKPGHLLGDLVSNSMQMVGLVGHDSNQDLGRRLFQSPRESAARQRTPADQLLRQAVGYADPGVRSRTPSPQYWALLERCALGISMPQ